MEDRHPLVSVIVITYNSEKYVQDTLDSILSQSYKNIEVIISDDDSTDNTVLICKNWLQKNREAFVNSQLLESPKNTGISSNCQRALNHCSGNWLKPIAGDDILLPNCISDCITYVTTNSNIYALFGRLQPFGTDNVKILKAICQNIDLNFFSKTVDEQLQYLTRNRNCLPAPSAFLSLDKMKDLGICYDERIPMLEDHPMWINFLRSGIKLHFIDRCLVKYRVGGLSTGARQTIPFYKSTRLFRFYYQYPEWCSFDSEDAVQSIVSEECDIYKQLLQIESSHAYAIGKIFIRPFAMIKSFIKKISEKDMGIL